VQKGCRAEWKPERLVVQSVSAAETSVITSTSPAVDYGGKERVVRLDMYVRWLRCRLFQNPLLFCMFGFSNRLYSAQSVLLINVPVAFLLHAVLEDHGNAEDEDHVYAHDAEGGSEDSVQVGVGERGELADAASLLSGDQGVLACAVLHEWGGCRVHVTAAVELYLVSLCADQRRDTFYALLVLTADMEGLTFCCRRL
jgi:hypothetical protein